MSLLLDISEKNQSNNKKVTKGKKKNNNESTGGLNEQSKSHSVTSDELIGFISNQDVATAENLNESMPESDTNNSYSKISSEQTTLNSNEKVIDASNSDKNDANSSSEKTNQVMLDSTNPKESLFKMVDYEDDAVYWDRKDLMAESEVEAESSESDKSEMLAESVESLENDTLDKLDLDAESSEGDKSEIPAELDTSELLSHSGADTKATIDKQEETSTSIDESVESIESDTSDKLALSTESREVDKSEMFAESVESLENDTLDKLDLGSENSEGDKSEIPAELDTSELSSHSGADTKATIDKQEETSMSTDESVESIESDTSGKLALSTESSEVDKSEMLAESVESIENDTSGKLALSTESSEVDKSEMLAESVESIENDTSGKLALSTESSESDKSEIPAESVESIESDTSSKLALSTESSESDKSEIPAELDTSELLSHSGVDTKATIDKQEETSTSIDESVESIESDTSDKLALNTESSEGDKSEIPAELDIFELVPHSGADTESSTDKQEETSLSTDATVESIEDDTSEAFDLSLSSPEQDSKDKSDDLISIPLEKTADENNTFKQLELENSADDKASLVLESPDNTLERVQPNKQGFDWSLDKIPGFDSGLTGTLIKSPTKFIGLFSSSSKNKSSSSKGLIFLFIPILLGAVVFWANNYYDNLEQENRVEIKGYSNKLTSISMQIKKYNLDEKHENNLEQTKTSTETVTVKSASEEMQQNEQTEISPITKRLKDITSELSGVKVTKYKSPIKKQKFVGNNKMVISSTFPMTRDKTTRKVKTKKIQPFSSLNFDSMYVDKDNIDTKLLANIALQDGNYLEAHELFAKSAKIYPDDVDLWLGLGMSSSRLGDYNQALIYYQQALDIDSYNIEAQKKILMLESNKDEEWLNQVQEMLDIYPDDTELFMMLGEYYADNRNWYKAEKIFKNLFNTGKNSPELALNLAIAEDYLGKYSQAYEHYLQAISQGENVFIPSKIQEIKKRLASLNDFNKYSQTRVEAR